MAWGVQNGRYFRRCKKYPVDGSEILNNHLVWSSNPVNNGDVYHINWCRISSINSIFHNLLQGRSPYPHPSKNAKIIFHKWQTVGLFQLDDSKSLHETWLFHQTSIKNWLFGVPGGGVLLGEFFYSDALMRKQYYWYEPKNPRISNQQRNKRLFLRLLAEYDLKFCRIRNLTHTELLLCFVFLNIQFPFYMHFCVK